MEDLKQIELSHQEYKTLTTLCVIAKNEYQAALKAGHGTKNPGKSYKVLKKILSRCKEINTSGDV